MVWSGPHGVGGTGKTQYTRCPCHNRDVIVAATLRLPVLRNTLVNSACPWSNRTMTARPGPCQEPTTPGPVPAPATRIKDRTTGRLSLRRPTLDDLDAMFEIHADPETARHSPTGPIVATRDEAKRMLLLWVTDWAKHGFGYWAVRVAGTEPVVGFGGVTYRAPDALGGALVANLYYRFRPSAWGNGYATDVAREAVAMIGELAPEARVVALVRPTNIASARVAQHAGLAQATTVELKGTAMNVFELDKSVARS